MGSTTNSCVPRRLVQATNSRSADSATVTAAEHTGEATANSECECAERSNSETAIEDGIEYCLGCGIILSKEQLERSEPNWREPEDRRLGPGSSQQWVDTGTVIGWGTSDTEKRLSRYNDRLTSGERSLVAGLHEIRSLSASVELPVPTRERAAYWFRNVSKNHLLKGRSTEGFAAACVFVAARERRNPITIDQLAAFSLVTESKIRNHVRVLRAEFSIMLPPTHPRDFLPRLVSTLELGTDIERRAKRYLTRASEEGIHVGKHPVGVAAAAIYAAVTDLGHAHTQETIAKSAGVSAITISRRYQDFEGLLTESE